jgi:aspartyl-tRNA(Asn)/glutamyl-tRNA(Gln) amidotransferase subunit A
MDENQLVNLTLTDAATLIKEKQLSPTELIEACLARIERLNPTLNAFLSVMDDQAQEEARNAAEAIRRGEDWGPLHGIPVGIKDLIDVAGVPTTAGSDFLRDHVAAGDADVTLQLKSAGAIIIGKTHLHEYAIGATNVNPHYGPARNPWNRDYSPGGSSGGSAAAVAASLCLGALGTDTGGSVREPSALCGLTGIRPGIGRVSTRGVIPMSWTLDTVGPMAHTAEDVALMLDVLDAQQLTPARCMDRLKEPVEGLRLGLPEDDFFWQETDFQIVESVQGAVNTLADQGMQVVRVRLSMTPDIRRAAQVISLSDAAAYHRERLEAEPGRFGDDVRVRLEWGTGHSGVDYALARQLGREWRQALEALFRDRVDVLALPTVPVPSHRIEGSEGSSAARELLRFTYPFSLSGLPALSTPCGFTTEGFPVGVQLVAAGEAILTQVAHAYQQITGWHRQHPAL